MSTSLAAQLAGIQANNNATILDKSKRRKIHSVSLVYEPKEAASQDFETIYYDCVEAFQELEGVDRRFGAFENSLFSETSIRFDRTIQSGDQTDALNLAIEQFLMLVSEYLHLSSAFRALEWLVRRFQIQIHNTESLILATLPYYDSANEFVRILDIISAQQFPPIFQFLTSCKSAMQGPSRSALVRVCTKDPVLLETINQFELVRISRGYSYNRELVFWSSLNILVAMVYKEQGEAAKATDSLLPQLSEVIVQREQPQAQIAAYMQLSMLSSQFRLSDDVINAAINTVVAHWSPASCMKGLECVAMLMEAQEGEAKPLEESVWKTLVDSFGSVSHVVYKILDSFSRHHHVAKLTNSVVLSVLKHCAQEFSDTMPLILEVGVSDSTKNELLAYVLNSQPLEPKLNSEFVRFVEHIAVTLSTTKIDELEIALQSSIKRPSSASGVNGQNGEAEAVQHFGSEKAEDENGSSQNSAELKRQVIEEAANMEQSTERSFLNAPLSSTDSRARIWSRAAGLGLLDLDELRQLARVSPEAQLSFVIAIAIGPWPTVSRCAAIRVAYSLVSSVLSPESGGDPSNADFQALLPFVMFLLSDPEHRVRKEASKLLRSMAHSSAGKKTPRWEDLSPASISWLSRGDLQNVQKRLLETLEECVMDPDYIFTATRQAGKASWCEFLVSIVLSTNLPQILWVTLKALSSFKGVAKQISKLLTEWNTPNTRDRWQKLCSAAKFPLSGIERSLVSVLRSNDNVAITFLLDVMRYGDADGIASMAGEQIVQIWSEVLRPEVQERVADAMIDMSVDDKVAYDSQSVLMQLQPFSSGLFTKLLNRTANIGDDEATPLFSEASKRRRRRSSSTIQLRGGPRNEVNAEAERHLRRTTLVLELLEASAPQLTDTTPLVAVLFDILEELMALGEGSRLPVLYTEELLANCMIALVESLKSQGVRSRELNSLKVNVVVSCIRTSSSPQVQNRLLLLVAALATLCPDAVLHGVMPIFTFMGANTVRLDNDFSAHVIEQTIEQVIPALVAAGDKHEEVEMALMSFVAAFPHVPRHRRNTLFGALIKTLGPSQSLYKLLLLLGQRYADTAVSSAGTRGSRSSADAKALVHFATPFLRSFSASEQIHAISSYVQFIIVPNTEEENSRFGLRKIKEALKESTHSPKLRNSLFEFLGRTAGEAEVIAGTQPLRVQIDMAETALDASVWQQVTSVIGMLLQEIQDTGVPAANGLLVMMLEILPIDRFASVVKPLISASNERVLNLVSKKFEYSSTNDELDLAAARDILDHLIDIAEREPASSVIDAIDPIVERFGTKLRSQELRFLEVMVGPSGILNQDIDVTISAILGINAACHHLGAAMYGFFPRIFPVLCEKVRFAQEQDQQHRDESKMEVDEAEEEHDSDEEDDDDIELAVFALFAGLVRQMPRFMAPEILPILQLVLASHISTSSRVQLLKVLDDKIDPRILLSGLSKSWPAVLKGGISAVGMFFAALGSTIEKIPKRDLAAEMPNVTLLLLDCLSVRQSSTNSDFVNQVEAKAIDCTLAAVLRLNDRVFRPQFKRVISWGFENGSTPKQIAVLKFANRVLGQLKGVVTSYFGFLLDDACAILEQGNAADAVVRKLILQAITTSLSFDQDDFWQSPSRFDRVSRALVGQLTTVPMTHGSLVVKALTALALASSPQHRKQLNESLTQLIVATAPVTQKIWTIKVLSSLYRRLGEDWVVNLPQLVPLIAELLDDEDESVELETRKSLVPVIEGVLGESLDRYLA